jgi:predicted AAA+ superfamily ATPase
LLESFVWSELDKEAAWSRTRPRIHHYRSHGGDEVDFILEDASGRCIGVEVKAARHVAASDFRALHQLRDALGSRWIRGIVLYAGSESLPFGQQSLALPISALWR